MSEVERAASARSAVSRTKLVPTRHLPLYRWSALRGRSTLGLIGVCGFVLVWGLVTGLGWVPYVFLPGPNVVAQELWRMMQSGELATNLAVSGARLSAGFVLGSSVGAALGILTARSATLDGLTSPFVTGIYTLPKLALMPLLILWLGIGEPPKIALVAVGSFFPVLVNTYTGVNQTSRNLVLAARNLSAGELSLMTKVFLPSALPLMLAGLRLGFGQSLLLIVAAEMLAGNSGIGFAILQAGNLMATSRVIALLLIFGSIGIGSSTFLRWFELKICPWAEGSLKVSA